MIEISPLVYLDRAPQKENEDFIFQKQGDKSIKFSFKKRGITIRIVPSGLDLLGPTGAPINNPIIYFNDMRLSSRDYNIVSYQSQDKPGLDIFFSGLPFKQLGLIPRVLLGDEERKYRQDKADEARRKYEKEHGFLFK